MNKKIIGLALATAFSVGTAQAALIDDFEGGALSIAADGNISAAHTGAIGGSRNVSITKAASELGGPLTATAAVIAPPGIYSHSADSLTTATSIITWNAGGAGLGGIDLIEGLVNNFFSFNILSIDQGNIDLILRVMDTGTGDSSYTFSGADDGIQQVAFSKFTGIDFTLIDFLSLEVRGGAASDLTLDQLETSGERENVPEPTSIALMGMGLAAFGFSRRKAVYC